MSGPIEQPVNVLYIPFLELTPIRSAVLPSTAPSPVFAPAFNLSLDKCYATVYGFQMKIRNFAHKGLKRLYEDDKAKGVPPDIVDKLRKMLAYLDDMENPEELRALTAWKVHTLTGDRKGT